MELVTQSAGTAKAPASASQTAPKPPSVRDGSVTLSALIDAYMAAYDGRDTTRVQRLSYWQARLGARTLDELSDDDVFVALEELASLRGRYHAGKDAEGRPIFRAKRKPLAAATLNRYQAALSAVLTWAIRRRIAPKGWHNPCRNLELRRENNQIVRFLSDDERAALLTSCRASKWPRLYLLVLMALTTGARRGELEGLRWRDIDLDRAEASILHTKNGDRKVLPLVPAVVEELRRFEGAPSALVFPSKRRPDVAFNFIPAWQQALKAAGIRRFRFHDCRHTTASYLAQAGAPLLQIAEVLGHRQLSVTKRYSHLTVKHKAELVTRVLGDIR